MNRINQVFSKYWESFVEIIPNILIGLIALVFFSLIGYVLNRVINNRLKKKWQDNLVATFMGEIIKWVFITLGLIVALHFVGFGGIASSIVAGAGISALIIGFAFKDIAENFLAGILLAVNRPFNHGDIIESGEFKGTVKKLDLRVAHVRTVDGRDIYIPNSMILKSPLTNYTKDGLIRQEFMVGLDGEDDLKKARTLIVDYLLTQQDVLKEPKPNVLVDHLADYSVAIKVLFWIDVFSPGLKDTQGDVGETVKSKIIREVKDLLLENGFNMPNHIIEHKMYREDSPIKIKSE